MDNKHKSNLIYGYHIPGRETETYHYIGMTKVRHETRIHEHIFTDKKNGEEHDYTPEPSNFTILAQGYNAWLYRRICGSLFARDYKPFFE